MAKGDFLSSTVLLGIREIKAITVYPFGLLVKTLLLMPWTPNIAILAVGRVGVGL